VTNTDDTQQSVQPSKILIPFLASKRAKIHNTKCMKLSNTLEAPRTPLMRGAYICQKPIPSILPS
jgi:hypothetical protein